MRYNYTVALGSLFLGLAGFGLYTQGVHVGEQAVPLPAPMTIVLQGERLPVTCEEDEVLAVQLDRDPSHGLTWRCENIEEFIERQGQ